jgi:hypothetical protein
LLSCCDGGEELVIHFIYIWINQIKLIKVKPL